MFRRTLALVALVALAAPAAASQNQTPSAPTAAEDQLDQPDQDSGPIPDQQISNDPFIFPAVLIYPGKLGPDFPQIDDC